MQSARRYEGRSASANLDRLKLLFEEIRQEFKLTAFATRTDSKKCKIETSFILFEVQDRIKLMTTLSMQETSREMKIETITKLCYPDLSPTRIDHHHLIRLMARYFIKLNGSFRFGFFAIDANNGNISFRVNSNTIIGRDSVNSHSIKVMLKINLTTAYFALKFHIYKILYMINLLTRKEVNDVSRLVETRLDNPNPSYRKVNVEFTRHLDHIADNLLGCTQNPPSWKPEYKSHLEVPKSADSNSYKATIVTPIEITKIEERKSNITSGGFGDLSLLKINYKIRDGDERTIIRYIVMKEEKKSVRNNNNNNNNNNPDEAYDGQRMNNEHYVLQHFYYKKSASQFVAKFYHAEEQNKKENGISERAILMEYYPHKSLEHFRQRNDSMSLNTKIWFLIQIANGIRFLVEEDVFHLDLKFSNMLIQKNFIVRLIDFGESFLKNPAPELRLPSDKYRRTFKPGRTLPFAPPELLQKPFICEDLSERTDVFSFGILMGEFLFDQFLVDFKKSNLYSLQQKYQTLSYKTKFTSMGMKSLGPHELYKYLRIIAMLCIYPEADKRPTLEWIVIMLKEAIHFLEKMY